MTVKTILTAATKYTLCDYRKKEEEEEVESK